MDLTAGHGGELQILTSPNAADVAAEFRKRFDAAIVKLAEKSHENIELKLIPKDAIEAEAAKVQ